MQASEIKSNQKENIQLSTQEKAEERAIKKMERDQNYITIMLFICFILLVVILLS